MSNLDTVKMQARKLMQKGSYSSETRAGSCMAGFYLPEDVEVIIEQAFAAGKAEVIDPISSNER